MIQLPDESVVEERYMTHDTELKFLFWPNDNQELMHPTHGFMRREYEIDYEDMLRYQPWQCPPRGMHDVYLNASPTIDEIMDLNVAVCDWGVASWHDRHLSENITPDKLRSPEVLIGAPWDSKTDLWTLGVMLVDLMTGREAFVARERYNENCYSAKQHLHEITTNFGPFPRSFLDRGRKEYLKATFAFDGEVLYKEDYFDIQPFEECFSGFDDEEDKLDFLKMLKNMMRIDPQERSSAAELLEEPWLSDVVLDRGIIEATQPTKETCLEHADIEITAAPAINSRTETHQEPIHQSRSANTASPVDSFLDLDSKVVAISNSFVSPHPHSLHPTKPKEEIDPSRSVEQQLQVVAPQIEHVEHKVVQSIKSKDRTIQQFQEEIQFLTHQLAEANHTIRAKKDEPKSSLEQDMELEKKDAVIPPLSIPSSKVAPLLPSKDEASDPPENAAFEPIHTLLGIAVMIASPDIFFGAVAIGALTWGAFKLLRSI